MEAARAALQREKDGLKEENRQLQEELSRLSGVVAGACGDLLVAPPESQGGPVALAARIVPRVGELEENAMRAGVKAAFAVARSHYGESFQWDILKDGYAPGCEDEQIVEMEEAAAAPAKTLTDILAPFFLPRRDPAPPQ